MKIRTLNLTSFGKFQNKTIEVADGFNLIFGRNEAGKTTIQHFIEGMLFGFYKPYRKRRTFSDDYYRFKPRYGECYCGSMVIEDDEGRMLRIERDFLQTRDGVRIYDHLTGEDISTTFPYDHVNKQYMPMGYGSFNAALYNNTVNVKQLSSQSGPELAKEVNDYLMRMATDPKDAVSVERVLNYISDQKRSIGTVGRSKTQYGQTVREIAELEKQLQDSQIIVDQIKDNQERIRKLEADLALTQAAYDDKRLVADQAIENEQAYLNDQLDDLESEMKDITQQLESMKGHEDADSEIYGHLKVVAGSVEAIEDRMAHLLEKSEELIAEQARVENNREILLDHAKGHSLDEIEADYEAFRSLDQQKSEALSVSRKRTLANEEKKEAAVFTEAYAPKRKKRSTGLTDNVSFAAVHPAVYIACILLGLVIGIFGFINPIDILNPIPQIIVIFIGLFMLVCGVLFFVLRNKEINADDDFLDEEDERFEIDSLQSFSFSEASRDQIFLPQNDFVQAKTGDISQISHQMQQILQKYDCTDAGMLETFVLKCRQNPAKLARLQAAADHIADNLANIEEEYRILEKEREENKLLVDQALESVGAGDLDDYGLLCQDHDTAQKLEAQLEADQRLYDELTRQLMSISEGNRSYYYAHADLDMESLQSEIEDYNHALDKLKGENQSLTRQGLNPVTIRERIEALKADVNRYEEDLKACDMVEKFFTSYSKRIHSDSVPDLNRKIGSIIEGITHKYSEVHVDDQMNIRVIDPDHGTMLSLSQLSGGTVDQLSLALRFGITDLFDREATMPLLLDDPFVQYDDYRKEDAIGYLSSLTPKKQILLFTCTADEKHILDEHQYPYNGIGV